MSSSGRQHALKASELLVGAKRFEEQLAGLDEMQRLEMAATGGFTQANKDLEWTVKMAIAHALASIAMSMSE